MRRVAGLDWRVAMAFAICLVLAAMAVTHSRQLACEHQRPRVQAEQKSERGLKEEQAAKTISESAGHGPPSVDQVMPGPQGGKGEDQTKECDDEGAEFWPSVLGLRLKITDSLLVLLTAALAFYTSELNKSTLKLWSSGERQIKAARKSAKAAKNSAEIAKDALIAGSRPWMDVTPDYAAASLEWHEINGPTVTIPIIAENKGNAPAVGVMLDLRLVIKPFSQVVDWNNFVKETTKRPHDLPFGNVVFVGEIMPQEISNSLGIDKVDEWINFIAQYNRIEPSEINFIPYKVIISVAYRTSAESSFRYTTRIYDLLTPSQQGGFEGRPVSLRRNENCPAGSLIMRRDFIGEYAT